MDPDAWYEPLNLSVKKKPVAVVAPSSVIDSKSDLITELSENSTMTIQKIPRLHRPFETDDYESTKIKSPECVNNTVCLDLTITKNDDIKNDNCVTNEESYKVEQNHETFSTDLGNRVIDYKNTEKTAQNVNESVFNKINEDYIRKMFENSIKSENVNNDTDSKEKQNVLANTDTIYSMINHLAEQKLLQALYMNSVLSQSSNLSNFSQFGNINYNFNSIPNIKHYPVLNNLLVSSQNSYDNTDFFKSKTEALTIKVPDNTLDLSSKNGAVTTKKEKNRNTKRASMDQKNSTSDHNKNNQDGNNSADKKKPHIKKPLNAFMLYMKEMRAKVVAECTLKESAAINQILGRRWHALGREEQAKYYELARRERQLHMQLYPDWSSRANASRGKKRKRKQETNEGGNSMKKCRARYGLDQQSQWCKPCRRKKKCIRYMETGDSNDGNQSDDNLGSCGSVGEAQTPPDDDTESLNQSLSSPGGLSGLSSLTSPSMILPSPSTSLASPSVSLASPCMSLQSPLTPHDVAFVDCSKPLNLPTTSAISVASHLNHQAHNHNPPQHRNPVGTNPHDINNPLSVNQLTGQCVKNSNSNTDVVVDKSQGKNKEPNRPVISVT